MASAIDLSELTSEHLVGNYWKGNFGEFELICDTSTGSFNSTKLSQLEDKDVTQWIRLKGTKALIASACVLLGIPRMIPGKKRGTTMINPVIKYIVNGGTDRETWGTYLHAILLNPLAQWISPDYTMKVSVVMHKIHVEEARAKDALFENKLDRKRNKISNLDQILTEVRESRKEARKEAKKARLDAAEKDKQLKKLMIRSGIIMDQNDELADTVEDVKNKLTTAKDRRVVHLTRETEYHLAIHRNNGDDDGDYSYTSIRAQLQGLRNGRRRQAKRYPDHEEILTRNDVPNATRFWNAVRAACGNNLINFNKGCTSFDLKDGFSERRFLRIIDQVYDRRFDDDL